MIRALNYIQKQTRILQAYFRLSKSPFNSGNAFYSLSLDYAYNTKSIEELKMTIEETERYLAEDFNNASMADLYYDLGSAYSNLNNLYYELNDENNIPIIMRNIEKILKYYRLALSLFRNGELKEDNHYISSLKTSLYTNYANLLVQLGRYAEGFKNYYDVLAYEPEFDIAKGLLGIALLRYSNASEPCLYTDTLKRYASTYLQQAIVSRHYQITDQTRKDFIEAYDSISVQLIESVNDTKHALENNRIKLDKKYRKWISNNHLFLSLLGDLEGVPMKYLVDDLRLPALKKLHDKEPAPIFFFLFNQLKYDYLYARLKVYTSFINKKKKRLYLKDSYLTYTNDDSVFNVNVEDLKVAFALAYSVFDKIASFINLYFDLGIKSTDVSFGSIWTNEKPGKNGYTYKHQLDYSHNMGLLCLYWINRDFKDRFGLSLDPENKIIRALRHANEHRFIMVHTRSDYSFKDEYKGVITHITYDELEDYCLALLALTREALIALTIAVYEENCYRESDDNYTLNLDDAIELGTIDGKDL